MSGVYVHIPFCKKKCSYCDFHFSTTFESYRGRMLQAMTQEIVSRKSEAQQEIIQTIYFGGGTPSLLSTTELKGLLTSIRENYRVDDAEITLEANPDDINEKQLDSWRKLGINRLSIGLQSFKASDLEWMNRSHTVDQSTNSVLMAKAAGFDNITVDLIYGLPGLSNDDWETHLHKVLELDIDHISAYCLTIEEGTALNNWLQKQKIVPASEDVQSQHFDIMLEILTQNGYEQYEISNFARNHKYSQHNSSYWTGESYVGIGPSAHSFNGSERRWNVANNSAYMKGLESNESYFTEEILSLVDRWNETLMTGLRTAKGVEIKKLAAISDLDEDFLTKLRSFEQTGDLTIENDIIVLTQKGKVIADHITSELFKTN
jgi:oxygen-independent coproporphyrinogen-3 oxidase